MPVGSQKVGHSTPFTSKQIKPFSQSFGQHTNWRHFIYTKILPLFLSVGVIVFGLISRHLLKSSIKKNLGIKEHVILDSLVVRISACHVEGPGSIPGRGDSIFYVSRNRKSIFHADRNIFE